MRWAALTFGLLGLAMAGCGPNHPWQGGGSGNGPFCGGLAGIACPGAGSCVDDPSDTCDPAHGGADCGGMCLCDALGKCPGGSVWDSSPEVCSCVSDEPELDVCAAVRCMAGTHCIADGDSAACVPDDPPVGEPCGNATCAAGEVCCNASCGICTPPDGACIQMECEES